MSDEDEDRNVIVQRVKESAIAQYQQNRSMSFLNGKIVEQLFNILAHPNVLHMVPLARHRAEMICEIRESWKRVIEHRIQRLKGEVFPSIYAGIRCLRYIKKETKRRPLLMEKQSLVQQRQIVEVVALVISGSAAVSKSGHDRAFNEMTHGLWCTSQDLAEGERSLCLVSMATEPMRDLVDRIFTVLNQALPQLQNVIARSHNHLQTLSAIENEVGWDQQLHHLRQAYDNACSLIAETSLFHQQYLDEFSHHELDQLQRLARVYQMKLGYDFTKWIK